MLVAKERRLREQERLRQQEAERFRQEQIERQRSIEQAKARFAAEQARRRTLKGRTEAAANKIVDGVSGTAETAVNVAKFVGGVGLFVGSALIRSQISNLTDGDIHVNAYTKTDGTRVKSHWRKRS